MLKHEAFGHVLWSLNVLVICEMYLEFNMCTTVIKYHGACYSLKELLLILLDVVLIVAVHAIY